MSVCFYRRSSRFLIISICFVFVAAGMFLSCERDDDSDNGDEPASDDDPEDDDDDNDDDDTIENPFLNPGQPGPYLVGNASFFFEDVSRKLSCGQGNRILLTEVWYPAADNAQDFPENYITDFFLGRDEQIEQAMRDLGLDPEQELNNLPTGSYRDAPLHPDAGPMPILVFSHGFSSNRFQNYTMAAYLAGHGYLVVAPDHICNAKVTLTPDAVVTMSWANSLITLFERKADASFLVDVFTQTPPAMFHGRLNTEKIGFWGHSFGGFTVSEQIKDDFRISAMVQLASFGFPSVPPEVTLPSMYLYGKQDKVMLRFRNFHDRLIANMPLPKYELEFFETGHFAFSDLCEYSIQLAAEGNGCGTEQKIGSEEMFTNPDHDQLHQVINGYITAFFGVSFFGYEQLAGYLDNNHWPQRMQYVPHTK